MEWVHNRAPDAGRTGPLQAGLAHALSARVLVWPVDRPLASAQTLRALRNARGEWVVPAHEGRGGHPIALGPTGIAAVMSAPPAMPIRDVPRAVGMEVTRVAVEDVGVLANLDTPADVARARDG